MRNPFRFTIRPGTNEVWIGDVGWNTWEEVNRITNPEAPTVTNFGWPCYEGTGALSSYDNLNLTICENLYAQPGAVTAPYYTYNHGAAVVTGDTCPTGNGSSIAGLAFYNGGVYPANYNGALFFADYSRSCIWAMFPGSNGLPNPANRAVFKVNGTNATNPVDLQIGPGGDLFYVNLAAGVVGGGQVRRYRYTASGNNPPVAFHVRRTIIWPNASNREL